MKPYLLVLCGTILFVAGIFIARELSILEVENIAPEVVEVAPDWYDESCAECSKAYEDAKRKKELLSQETDLKTQIEALQGELDTVQKELGSY